VSEPEGASHHGSVAVWDLASPVVIGRRATLKAGIACSSGCDLTGARIDIYDDTGRRVGGGEAGSIPWPATRGLHWVECDVEAPDVEGEHSWSVQATASGASHTAVSSVIRFIASRLPEHRVSFEVIEKGSGVPLAGVELRLGTFRTATNDAGVAHVDVPGGRYEACGWKIGYDLLSTTLLVSSDTTLHLEVTPTPEAEQPYWM
jgi:hypothetical protein